MNCECVTCIILSYNKFNGLFSAIKSVLEQDYERIEVIVADDCSKDFPEEEILEFIKKHQKNNLISIKILHNQQNLGTVKNLNNAIMKSSGSIIINLSGDDLFYDKCTISKIVGIMHEENYTHLICRRVTKSGNFIPSNVELERIERVLTAREQLSKFVIGQFNNLASGCVFSYKKDFIIENGLYDDEYKLWEDGPFFYKILKKGIKINTNYKIISIVYAEDGISSKKNPILKADEKKFMENLMKNDWRLFTRREKRIIKFLYVRAHMFSEFLMFRKLLFIILHFDIIIFRRIKYRQKIKSN